MLTSLCFDQTSHCNYPPREACKCVCVCVCVFVMKSREDSQWAHPNLQTFTLSWLITSLLQILGSWLLGCLLLAKLYSYSHISKILAKFHGGKKYMNLSFVNSVVIKSHFQTKQPWQNHVTYLNLFKICIGKCFLPTWNSAYVDYY